MGSCVVSFLLGFVCLEKKMRKRERGNTFGVLFCMGGVERVKREK